MTHVISEAEVMHEAAQILLQHLSPAKAVRFWASWQGSRGNYLDWRDEQFAGMTVAELVEEIRKFQANEEIS